MTQTPLWESLALRGFFTLGLQFILRLRGFLLLPVLTRVLTPSELGLMGLGAAFCAGLSPLLLLGLSTGLSLQVVRLHGAAVRPAIFTVLSFSTLFAVVVTVMVLAVVATGVFGAVFSPLLPFLWPIGILAIGLTLREVTIVLPQIQQRLRFMAWNSLLIDFGGTLAAIALVLLGLGPGGALFGVGSLALLGSVVAGVYSLRIAEGPWHFNKPFLGATLRTALPVVPLAVSLWVLLASDYFFVSRYRGPADVAIYGLAYSLAAPTLMAAQAMNQTYLPTCIEILRHGRESFARFMDDSIRLLTVAGVATIAFATAAGPQVSMLIGGGVYEASGRLLPVVVAAYLFFTLSQLVQLIPGAMSRDMTSSARAHVAAAIFNVAANAIVVPEFGIWGAAWSTCAGYALAFALLARSVRVLLPELRFGANLGRVAVLTAFSVAAAILLRSLASNLILGLLLGLGAVLITGSCAVAVGLLSRADLTRLPKAEALRRLFV